jgi:hypothetical protein
MTCRFASDDADPLYEQFASKISIWEADELRCIFDYLCARMQRVVDELEDEVIHEAKTRPISSKINASGYLTERYLEYYMLNLFENKSSQKDWAKHIAEFGLCALKKFIDMGFSDRWRMLSIISYRDYHMSLAEALDRSHPWRFPLRTESTYGSYEDQLSKPNAGWLWVSSSEADVRSKFARELRSTGYVFWDRRRLCKSGLTNCPIPLDASSPEDSATIPPGRSFVDRCRDMDVSLRQILNLGLRHEMFYEDILKWISDIEY